MKQKSYGKAREKKREHNQEDMMKDQLEKRLSELKAEFESGQKMLADLEAREANMRAVLHRISGAIQVLEEELAKSGHLGQEKNKDHVQEEGLLKQSLG